MPPLEEQEYSWLRHVCNGVLLGHNPEETYLAVVTLGKSIYLDDAGHPVDKPYLVLGGFLATETRWIDFEKPWSDVLRLHGLPLPFHATDYFSQNSGDPKSKHVARDLVRVISNHVEAAFSVALDVDAYKRINQVKRLEECAGAPIAMISRVLRKNVDTLRERLADTAPLLYFIERGTYQRGDIDDCWKYLDGVNPPISVAKAHPSAQAGDLYAYSVYQSAPFTRPSWLHKIFYDTFQYKRLPSMDGRVMESDMRSFLARKTSVMNGERTFIPDRVGTEGIGFTFKGNKNKQQNIRRAKIGVDKK